MKLNENNKLLINFYRSFKQYTYHQQCFVSGKKWKCTRSTNEQLSLLIEN